MTMTETSLDAYRQLDSFAPAHEDSITSYLWRHRDEGGTTHEIAAAIGLQEIQVNRRMSKLLREGRVYRTDTKRPTPSGRTAFVWYPEINWI